jgi:hypothetical protein
LLLAENAVCVALGNDSERGELRLSLIEKEIKLEKKSRKIRELTKAYSELVEQASTSSDASRSASTSTTSVSSLSEIQENLKANKVRAIQIVVFTFGFKAIFSPQRRLLQNETSAQSMVEASPVLDELKIKPKLEPGESGIGRSCQARRSQE